MKAKVIGLVVAVAMTLMVSQSHAAPILFDVDGQSGTSNPAGTTLLNWTRVLSDLAGTDSNGVTLTITGAAGGRDRGIGAGAINVPAGAFAEMYQDIIFTSGATNMAPGGTITATFTGLELSTAYEVTAWSYDSGATNASNPDAAVNQDFFAGGAALANITYGGDQGGPGPDPNTDALTDYSATFQIFSDANGGAVFTTSSSGSQGARLNGIRLVAVPEPASLALLSLLSLGMCAVRNRK